MLPTSSQTPPHPWASPFLLVLLGFVWGSSFILMKMGLFAQDGSVLFPPIELAALRMAIAGIVLIPIGWRHWKEVGKHHWKWILIVGFIGSFLPAILFATAQVHLPSALAGMLNALTPLWTLIIGIGVFGMAFHRGQFIGLAIGFIGTAALIWTPLNPTGIFRWTETVLPAALLVVATLCYGISVNITREKLHALRSPVIAACSLGIVIAPAFVVIFTGTTPQLILTHPDGWTGLAAIALLAALGTAGALVLFNQLIQWTSAVVAASVTYIIPVFATLWGWLDGEPLQMGHLIGGGLILFGVWTTHRMGPSKSGKSQSA